jgi:hypothetical protein
MVWLPMAGMLAILAIWFFAIWRSYEARRKHQPRDPNRKTSSDPSLIR